VIWRTLLATTCAALVTSSAADAALCIRLSTLAARPAAGDATIIQIKTFVPVGEALKPYIVRKYPFRVEAVSPRGKVFKVPVKPGRQNPFVSRGNFRFPTAGVWSVKVTNFPSYPNRCAQPLHVHVRSN